MGCDTLVALARATRDGATLFAKNSDRPPRECQRIVQIPRRRHSPGSRLRCQYLDLPQVRETAAVVGTQPYWLWGLEQGVSEHRVAIGNETVFAREALGPTGLLGMDLVRIGLERGRSAAAALEVMTDLLERYGQGGSGHVDLDWPYHNAFLIADPTSAWVLETSDRHWAARRVDDLANVSNGLALGRDWERGSPDLEAFAVARGWWSPADGRLDFAAAYGDDSNVPPNLCAARRRRAATLLAEARGRVTPAVLFAALRDHNDGGATHRPRPVDDPDFFSLCMHADPLDNTTAAMVATLPVAPEAPAPVWFCLGSPCLGAFLPCYLDASVPERLARGGQEPDPESPWWIMRGLLTRVEVDLPRFAPLVRARWDEFEATLSRQQATVEGEALAARRAGRTADAASVLTAFMDRAVAAYVAEAEALVREIEGAR
jgi:dipeptidase